MKYFFNEYFFSLKLSSLAVYSSVLPLLVFWIVCKRPYVHIKKKIAWFAGFSLFMEYVSSNRTFNSDFLSGTNSPFYHLGTPVLMLLVLWLYKKPLRKLLSGAGLLSLQIGLVLFCAWNAVWGDGLFQFPSLTVALYSIIGIALPLVYLYQLLQSMNVARLDQDPLFVSAAGLLIYYSGNFLLWLFITYIDSDNDTFYSIYRVNAVLCMVLNVFFCLAILTNTKTEENTQPSTT